MVQFNSFIENSLPALRLTKWDFTRILMVYAKSLTFGFDLIGHFQKMIISVKIDCCAETSFQLSCMINTNTWKINKFMWFAWSFVLAFFGRIIFTSWPDARNPSGWVPLYCFGFALGRPDALKSHPFYDLLAWSFCCLSLESWWLNLHD